MQGSWVTRLANDPVKEGKASHNSSLHLSLHFPFRHFHAGNLFHVEDSLVTWLKRWEP